MKKDNRFKKLSLKIRYLNLEIEEVKSLLTDYSSQFMSYIYTLQREHNIAIIPLPGKKCKKTSNCKIEEEVRVDPKRDRKQNEIFKDLYRQVAQVSHPDKTQKDKDKERLFRQATIAKNHDDLITQLDICDDLDINKPDLDDNHIKIIEKNIKKKEEEINRLKKSDAWVWGTADEKGRRRLEKVIIQRFKNKS